MVEEGLLSKLTAVQRQAVCHRDGPSLILAGPGSGKTRVITHRIAYLIEQGVRPGNILAITFTNKAAKEMQERVESLGARRGSTICTFHSLGARLLREFAEAAGLPKSFSIYDDSDQLAAVREALSRLEMASQNFPPAKMLWQISACKNDLEGPQAYGARQTEFRGKQIARVYGVYEKLLAENGALDFDDLLMRLALLLRDRCDLRDQLNERYKYVLVDEYQDTNACQYQMARALAWNHRNLCVTGDPDQSIYGWRGADIGNILTFEQDYPEAAVIRLEENFRSTPQVLSLADELIRANQQRKEKRLFSSLPGGSVPEAVEYTDEYDEAHSTAAAIAALRGEGYAWRDIAVFYRVNSLSRTLEEALRRARVPYQIVRGLEFFKRAEVKNMIAYLRLLINPSDELALKRIINVPTRGIGSTSVNRLFEHARRTGRPVCDVMGEVEQVETLSAAAKKRVQKFVELITSLQQQLEGPTAPLVQRVYQQSGLAGSLEEEKAANVAELIKSAGEYDDQTETPSLVGYLEQIALASDADAYDEQTGAVSLMTLHAAKGLEFPVVFVVAVENGLIPHTRSAASDAELEEERRLLFVGITRAQQRLTLSFARRRTLQGTSLATIRSEFLRGLQGLTFRESESVETLSLDSAQANLGWRRGQGAGQGYGHGQSRSGQGAKGGGRGGWGSSGKAGSGGGWSRAKKGSSSYSASKRNRADESKNAEDKAVANAISAAAAGSGDAAFVKGELVRHAKFGMGRIEQVISSRSNSQVVVQFNRGNRVTLALEYAKLEKVAPAAGSA